MRDRRSHGRHKRPNHKQPQALSRPLQGALASIDWAASRDFAVRQSSSILSVLNKLSIGADARGIQPSYRLYGGLPKYTNPTNIQFSVKRFIRVGHIPSRASISF